MKRNFWLTGAAAYVLMLSLAGTALAADTYVFPSAGFRYTQQDGETVLTRTNLKENTEFIESLGTTAEAVGASYSASGIFMEVYTADGSQISVSSGDASGFTDETEVSSLDEAGRSDLLTRFQDSGLYSECRWSEAEPDWMVLTSSAMYGSMPVWQLRYCTLHLGRFYMVTDSLIGREPNDADEQADLAVVRRIKLLNTVSSPTASPSPMPETTPELEAATTAVPAEVTVRGGTLQLDAIDSVVHDTGLTVAGTADASAKVVVRAGEKTLGTVTSGRNGRFTVKVTLPEKGTNTLTVTCGEAEAAFTVTYEEASAKLTITEPANFTFTGDSLMIRGVTEPNGTVYATGYKTNLNVKANKNGVFSIRLFLYEAGTQEFTIRAHLKGRTDTETTVTLTRVLTEREQLAEFRKKQVPVTYTELSSNPEVYSGKNYVLRGRVMGFTDYDGSPCALVCVTNKQAGVWVDPVYAVLSLEDDVKEGDVLTFYLVGEGITLPASGDYTESGTEAEAPVGRVFQYTTAR